MLPAEVKAAIHVRGDRMDLGRDRTESVVIFRLTAVEDTKQSSDVRKHLDTHPVEAASCELGQRAGLRSCGARCAVIRVRTMVSTVDDLPACSYTVTFISRRETIGAAGRVEHDGRAQTVVPKRLTKLRSFHACDLPSSPSHQLPPTLSAVAHPSWLFFRRCEPSCSAVEPATDSPSSS